MSDYLKRKYGPLMTLKQLAEVLDRTYDGLRVSLRSESAYSAAINAARVRLGRRVYFATEKIASILSGPQEN